MNKHNKFFIFFLLIINSVFIMAMDTVEKTHIIDFNNLDTSLNLQNTSKEVLFASGKNFLAYKNDIFDFQLNKLANNLQPDKYVTLVRQIKVFIDENNFLMTKSTMLLHCLII